MKPRSSADGLAVRASTPVGSLGGAGTLMHFSESLLSHQLLGWWGQEPSQHGGRGGGNVEYRS